MATRAVLATGAILIALATTAHAAEYTFTRIADSAGEFLSFGPPAVSGEGVVAFLASFEAAGATGAGIYLFDDGTITPIIELPLPFGQLHPPVINDAGTVAFVQTTDGTTQIRLWQNGTLSDAYTAAAFSTALSLNNAGQLVFQAPVGEGPETAILVADGEEVVDLTTSLGFTVCKTPAINDAGTVVFEGVATDASGLFTVHDNMLTTVAAIPDDIAFPGAPQINGAGTVVFTAFAPDTNALGMYAGMGPAALLFDDSGPLFTFNAPRVSDDGAIVFWGMTDGGVEGVFRGPDPDADAVIFAGDPLDGSTVNSISFLLGGGNATGSFCFFAVLADGRNAIFRADPVERSCEVLGDLDCDGAVSGADLGLLLADWGPCDEGVPCSADLNSDGVVNGADLGVLLGAWSAAG